MVSAADRMVRIEIEAAEALADLAQLATRESGGEYPAGKWGTKGKRARKRVKIESPASDSVLNSVDLLPRRSDGSDLIEQDKTLANQQLCEKLFRNVFTEPEKVVEDSTQRPVKVENYTELPKARVLCATNYSSSGCGRSRRNLSEAEKEARRIRRVLANRESARQTIRRRQALCEELTRKAADLAWESENLRREKELALNEYQSLKSTNRILKEQMAEAAKRGMEETKMEHKSAPDQTPPCDYPLFLYKRPPFMQIIWPPTYQRQHGPQKTVIVPSNIHFPATGVPDSSHELEHRTNLHEPRSPFYFLPCSWFFPNLEPVCQVQSQTSFSSEDKEDETAVAQGENHHSPLPVKARTDSYDLTDGRHARNFTGAQSKEMHPSQVISKPIGNAPSIKHENGIETKYVPQSKVGHISNVLPENNHGVISTGKKMVDSVAAAEARKRRKDLTKLKNVHGRQCWMQI